MKFSVMLSSGLLVLVGAVMLAEAGYGSSRNQGNYGMSHGMGAYQGGNQGYGNNNNRCHGYNCGGSAMSYGGGASYAAASNNRGPYGPYHSYAVRPAIYGGRGLYTYRGYARHQAAPMGHQRYARSCNGYNCGHSRRGAYQQQASRYQQSAPSYGYGLRPVKALVLTPMSSYGSGSSGYGQQRGGYGGSSSYGSSMNSGYGSGAGYGGHRAASYGRGHSSGGYNKANRGGY